MKPKLTLIALLLFGSVLLSFVFSGKDKKKLPKSLLNSFSHVPAGTINLNGETHIVDEFFICKTEVTNSEYKRFLEYVKNTGNAELIKKTAIDTANWIIQLGEQAAPLADYYHRHKAYANYPVVNISYAAALCYCDWLTEQTQKVLDDTKSGLNVEYSLPNRLEWIRASRGGVTNAIYAWGGPYARNAQGQWLANFYYLSSENIHYNSQSGEYEIVKIDRPLIGPGNLDDSFTYTAPSTSFPESGYGLFNMNGNVAEMVVEAGIAVGGSWQCTGFDIRNESIMEYEGTSIKVGFRPVASLTEKS